jgi:hypothetical protein
VGEFKLSHLAARTVLIYSLLHSRNATTLLSKIAIELLNKDEAQFAVL